MINGQPSEPVADGSIVPTARWVALSMFLIALVAFAGLWLSWRDFKDAENTQKALMENIQTVRGNYDAALTSLQRQLREAEAKDRALQAELNVVTNRLQFTQDDVELTRRQMRLFNEKQGERSVQSTTNVRQPSATKIGGVGEGVVILNQKQ